MTSAPANTSAVDTRIHTTIGRRSVRCTAPPHIRRQLLPPLTARHSALSQEIRGGSVWLFHWLHSDYDLGVKKWALPLDYSLIACRDIGGIWRSAGIHTGLSYLASVCRTLPAVARARSLHPADVAMPGRLYQFRPFPGTRAVTLDSRQGDDPGAVLGGAREMYCRRVYFPDARFFISPGDVVVDLGANIGLFTVMAACLGAQVNAYEAQSGFVSLLHQNLRRNNVDARVNVHLAMVGGRSGMLRDGAKTGSQWGSEPVDLSLIEIVRSQSLHHIDFLKVDIEGSEYQLFDGDLQWLEITRRIAMEVHPAYGDPIRLRDRLASLGFDTWLTTNTGRRVHTVTGPTGFLYGVRVTDTMSP